MRSILLICSLFLFGCKKADDTIDTALPRPTPIIDHGIFERQGHRGCGGLMPENTIPAMIKAVELGVTNIEMDLAITKDNKVIVSHDPFFNQHISTKPNGDPVTAAEQYSHKMYQMTYDEVKTYDVGSRYLVSYPQQQKIAAPVPLLADLIDEVEKYCIQKNLPQIKYNVEIKSNPVTEYVYYPSVKDYVELLMDVVRTKNIEARLNVSSFDLRALRYIHTNYPTISTTLLSNNMLNMETEVSSLGYYPQYYGVNYSTITPLLVTKAHSLGMKVIAFTVDTKASIAALKSAGVNGIISNYPNLF